MSRIEISQSTATRIAFVWIGLLWLTVGSTLAESESPTEVVRTTINRVIQILEDSRLKSPDQRLTRRGKLETVISERFDYAEMSKRTLAAQWRSLTEDEREEFIELFKAFLSDHYAEKIEGYAGEKVAYLEERTEGPYAEVRTRLVSDKLNIPMDYRLIKKDGDWYAYDIIVDGVSLVRNYRSQFVSIIRSSSYQELVRRLKERSDSSGG